MTGLGWLTLLIGGAAGALVFAVVRWLIDSRPDAADEELIEAFRAQVRAEVVREQLVDHELATEDDALAWGFPVDWMAAERVCLFWNSRRREQA